MIFKLIETLVNYVFVLIGLVFYALYYSLQFVCGAAFVLVPLIIPYCIWSKMFYILPTNPQNFILLVIPALIGSFLALSFDAWLLSFVNFGSLGKKGVKAESDSSDKKKSFWNTNASGIILVVSVMFIEIGVAYLYPAPMIDDRGYRYGNGYSSGGGSSESTNHVNNDNDSFWSKLHFGKKDASVWNNFEEKNRIGDAYISISADYPTLTEKGNFGGGVLLQANDSMYFTFPVIAKSDISNSDQCSGMIGTANTLFGYNDDITVSQLKEDLGLTSETFYDDNLTYKKTSLSGYYYVVIVNVDITKDSDIVTPDTWISVVQRNRQIIPVGSLASDQNATRETVYFVEDGNRYHRDSSCSTLHDSDVIYECYIDDVSDNRTPCGVCY